MKQNRIMEVGMLDRGRAYRGTGGIKGKSYISKGVRGKGGMGGSDGCRCRRQRNDNGSDG
jgi:hypothetical protein